MPDLNPQQKFLLELQHIIAKHRNDAAASEASAARLRESANAHQAKAEAETSEADRWQRLLDFAVLADCNNDLAHAFANAVLDRGSVDPFASVATYYAEWEQRATRGDATDYGRELDDVYAEGEREAEAARLAEENEAEAYDEPMTNRDVDPEHVDECDAYADAYSDTPIESGS